MVLKLLLIGKNSGSFTESSRLFTDSPELLPIAYHILLQKYYPIDYSLISLLQPVSSATSAMGGLASRLFNPAYL